MKYFFAFVSLSLKAKFIVLFLFFVYKQMLITIAFLITFVLSSLSYKSLSLIFFSVVVNHAKAKTASRCKFKKYF